MRIQLMDVKSQQQEVAGDIQNALNEIFEKCNFILGENVSSLEQEIAGFCQTGYGIGVANGTDALVLGLRALGINPGDEVITTAYTFYATAEAIAAVGAVPVFVDIDDVTMNIDPELIEAAITNKTKAIMPVHIFGYPADMNAVNSIAKEKGLAVLEDACQAIGAKYKGRRVGGLADGAAFSFFPTKNLSCAGDGGMFVTGNKQTADEVKMLRFHGSKDKKIFEKVGYNSRLDELQAAILRIKLKKIDQWNGNRAKIAKILTEKLQGHCKVPYEASDCSHVYHLYVIRTPNRDAMQAKLSELGIASSVYYGHPLHTQPVFSGLGYKNGDLPVTETSAAQGLALPMHPYLTDSDAEEIAEAVIQGVES